MPRDSSLTSSHLSDRRRFLMAGGLTTGGLIFTKARADTQTVIPDPDPSRFRFCLNMSTIRGQELDAAAEIELAGKVGYDAIEPWFGRLREYLKKGGTVRDLKKRIDDHGLTVESAIGFPKWIVDDPHVRAEGLEEAKRDMDLIAQLGGKRVAAPPVGVPKGESVSLDDAAERYRTLLELGDKMGVIPQVEMWGGNPTIGTMAQALYIAIASGHPKACFLGDVFHTYKGGSAFASILQLGPQAIQHYHMNDYPADPPQAQIRDADRVFTGDGIAPLTELLKSFMAIGAYPVLSLELFNPSYWAMPAEECAKIGLEKMKASVAAAT